MPAAHAALRPTRLAADQVGPVQACSCSPRTSTQNSVMLFSNGAHTAYLHGSCRHCTAAPSALSPWLPCLNRWPNGAAPIAPLLGFKPSSKL